MANIEVLKNKPGENPDENPGEMTPEKLQDLRKQVKESANDPKARQAVIKNMEKLLQQEDKITGKTRRDLLELAESIRDEQAGEKLERRNEKAA